MGHPRLTDAPDERFDRLPDQRPGMFPTVGALIDRMALWVGIALLVLGALFVADALYGAVQSYQRTTGAHLMVAVPVETLIQGAQE